MGLDCHNLQYLDATKAPMDTALTLVSYHSTQYKKYNLHQLEDSWYSEPPTCPQPGDEITKYPHETNCTLFWECYGGSVFLMSCPDGFQFNVQTSECDLPAVENCNSQPTTSSAPSSTSSSTETTIPSSTTTNGPGPECPVSEDPIYIPYDGDCSKYWECYLGELYLYNCPNGLWWHQELTDCDYPGDYCNNNSSTTSTSQTPSTTTTITTTSASTTTSAPVNITCPLDEPDIIYFPYPGDCTKYVECFEGEQFIRQCPPGLWWHETLATCDEPGSYCNNSTTTPITSSSTTATTGSTQTTDTSTSPVSTTTSGTTTTSNPDDITCPDPNDDPVFFPYPGDCTRFWECLEGIIYLNECSAGLWWHQEVSECDTPGDYCTQLE